MTGSVVYVRGDPATATGSGVPDDLRADFDVVLAESGVDALQRLAGDPSDVVGVVVPGTLRDLPLDVFVERVKDATTDAGIIVVGDLPTDPTEATIVTAVDGYLPTVDAASLGRRLHRHAANATVDRAVEDHHGLQQLVTATAVELTGVDDRGAIETVVFDRLLEGGRYQHVWVGRVDDEGDIVVSLPDAWPRDETWPQELVGGTEARFLERAIETGQVTPSRADTAGQAGETETDEPSGSRGLNRVAVPFIHRGQVLGVAHLASGAAASFAAAERGLLADLGAIVGHAIATGDPEQAGEPESPREDVETLIHELRNPLGIAMSHLELARADDDLTAIESAEAALERMADTIDRVGMGIGSQPSLDPSAGTLQEDATIAWETVSAERAVLEIEGSVSFDADHDLVVRLLSNLFQNAVEHGGESITVRAGPLDGGFYVEDDGPGIPPEERERVLERGYSTAVNGLGIGLSIVQDVAAAHGWEFEIAEGRDGGARFEITGIEVAAEEGSV